MIKEAIEVHCRACGGAFYLILGAADLYNREPNATEFNKGKGICQSKKDRPTR